MKNKSTSLKGDLLLTTVALLVVGGLCIKGAVSFNKQQPCNETQKITMTLEQNNKIS